MNININSISELLKICKNVGCSVKNKNDLRSVKKELILFLKNREQKGGAYGLCEVPHAVEVYPDYPSTYRITKEFDGRLARLAPGKYNLVKSDFVMGDSMHMKDRIQKVQALYLLQMISLFHFDIFHINNYKPEIKELIRNCKYAHITVKEILDMAIAPPGATHDIVTALNKFKKEKGTKLIGPDYNFGEFATLEYYSGAGPGPALIVENLFVGATRIHINRNRTVLGNNYLNDVGRLNRAINRAPNICYDATAQVLNGNANIPEIGYDGINNAHSDLATAIINVAEVKIKKLLTDDPGLRVFYIGILNELGSRRNNGSIARPLNNISETHNEMYVDLVGTSLVSTKYDNLSLFCNFLSGDPN